MIQTGASSIHVWTTDAVPVAQRCDYFAAACDSAVIPFSYQIPDPETFHASIESIDAGPLSIMRHTGAAHLVSSGKKEIARQTSHRFHLVMSHVAPLQLDHGKAMQLGVREAVVTDAQVETDLRILSEYKLLNIGFSVEWIREWIPSPDVFMARVISPKSKWGSVLTGFLGSLTPELIANAPLPGRIIVDQVGALLALAANELSNGSVAPMRRDRTLIDRIQDCTRQRCTELSLTAPEIARSLNVSTRTLHRALGGSGQTFGALLLQTRVDVATRMLESSLFRKLTVAEIGRRAGFSDPSHFARTFQKRMGATPSTFRKRGRSN